MEIFNWLNTIKVISKFKVISYKEWDKGFYYKLEIKIVDNSSLYAKEYSDFNERNYSFHWQKNTGKLIIRWDNAPHHKNLGNFPFHKHINNKTVESKEMTLKDAINYIDNLLNE